MGRIDLNSDLLNYIVSRDIKPGEFLPSIKELATEEHLGISTSKIREQLEVARAMGLVEVRSKTGTRLNTFSFTPTVSLGLFYGLARSPDLFEMFASLRTHIETAYWLEACAIISAETLSRMRKALERARTRLNSHPIHIPYDEHRIFHLSMFEQLDNPFVIGILEAYWRGYEAVEVSRYAEYSYLCDVWDYHEKILEALERRDYEGAKQLFIEHTRLLRYREPATNSNNEEEPVEK